MNQLPQVLRLEIWEYVHGDRKFWWSQFQKCINDIGGPQDVHRTFDQDGDQKQFFDETDFESLPSHGAFYYQPASRSTSILRDGFPWRFELDREFHQGELWLSRASDIILGVVFPEFVPEKVWLHFGAQTPIPLKPVGNRLKFPWIPIVALHMVRVYLTVETKQSFPCQIMHCFLDYPQMDFLADSPSTVTFRLGPESWSIRNRYGSVYVTN